MGFRFFKRVKIAPGLTLNLSKSGGSLSVGPRGAKLTVGPRGVTSTVGLPGTGMFYTTHSGGGRSSKKKSGGARAKVPAPAPARAPAPPPPAKPEDRLTLGFFKRLTVGSDEQALVDGLRELAGGNQDAAFAHLQNAVHLADGAFAAGFLALKKEDFDHAITFLTAALSQDRELGKYFTKYGIAFEVKLPVTEELQAVIGPNDRGVLLALAEAYQSEHQLDEALTCLRRLQGLAPDDVVLKLSLAELLLERAPTDRAACQEVVTLGEGVADESEAHAALLLYKARALRQLGVLAPAEDILTGGLRGDRSAELLRALRYERALLYEAQGQDEKARADFERLYADSPTYEDVAQRLGLT